MLHNLDEQTMKLGVHAMQVIATATTVTVYKVQKQNRLTLLGFVSCCMDCLRLDRGPSTRHWFSLKWFNSTFHKGCLLSTLGLPSMTSPYLARVRATFNLLGSLRKPIPCKNQSKVCCRLVVCLTCKKHADQSSLSCYSAGLTEGCCSSEGMQQ